MPRPPSSEFFTLAPFGSKITLGCPFMKFVENTASLLLVLGARRSNRTPALTSQLKGSQPPFVWIGQAMAGQNMKQSLDILRKGVCLFVRLQCFFLVVSKGHQKEHHFAWWFCNFVAFLGFAVSI